MEEIFNEIYLDSESEFELESDNSRDNSSDQDCDWPADDFQPSIPMATQPFRGRSKGSIN